MKNAFEGEGDFFEFFMELEPDIEKMLVEEREKNGIVIVRRADFSGSGFASARNYDGIVATNINHMVADFLDKKGYILVKKGKVKKRGRHKHN